MGRMDVDEWLFLPVVDRLWWGDLPPRKEEMLTPVHPFEYVRFTWDDVDRGDNPDLLDAMMQWEQRLMNTDHRPDIPYNFMIGKDGIVYEGRGWHKDAERPQEYASLAGRCLDIAYLGNFSNDDPPWTLIYSAHSLVLHGIKNKYVSKEFRVIPYSREKTK